MHDFRVRMPDVASECFIPFVVETSGRLGAKAAAFLVARQLPVDATRRLRHAIVMILARHGGRALTALRGGR